uniref:Uncharacterized protein n=1 Tax=Nelumbo nucifera TaxID=4432 RepID=A0A823A4S5_NELNU|nr:TPA_asm: hypothetical protein HUJ06_018815 [Nelumbo nucifera]
MGAVGGSAFHFLKGIYNSPKGERLIGGSQVVRMNSPRVGSSFTVWGGLFSVFDLWGVFFFLLVCWKKKKNKIPKFRERRVLDFNLIRD